MWCSIVFLHSSHRPISYPVLSVSIASTPSSPAGFHCFSLYKYSNLFFFIYSRLKAITLSSIVKFRNFTNETLTDILFFTSPMYCQVSWQFFSFSSLKGARLPKCSKQQPSNKLNSVFMLIEASLFSFRLFAILLWMKWIGYYWFSKAETLLSKERSLFVGTVLVSIYHSFHLPVFK